MRLYRGVYGHRNRERERESALKVDSRRKIPLRTMESNLRRRRASPMLYQLSHIPKVYWLMTVFARLGVVLCTWQDLVRLVGVLSPVNRKELHKG